MAPLKLLHIALIYLAVIRSRFARLLPKGRKNVVTFFVYGIDKWRSTSGRLLPKGRKKAKKSKWRIRETALLGLAVLGGSIGAWLGMEPGTAWREDHEKHPILYDGMERVLCPRVHFKLIIIDSTIAYVGSANLTGAGMGMKSPRKRNFEAGILTDDPEMLDAAIEQFDNVWIGKFFASSSINAVRHVGVESIVQTQLSDIL